MCLTRARLQPGEPVRLRVYTSSDMTDPMELDGEVVRSERWDDGGAFWPFSVGVRFTTPATKYLDRIREVSERQAALGLGVGRRT